MSWPLLVIASISVTACGYGVLTLRQAAKYAAGKKDSLFPKVELTRDGDLRLLSLALVNRSSQKMWAEECSFTLSNFVGTPSANYKAACSGSFLIREFIRPGETLRLGLCNPVYEAAGRPQDDYTFVISGTVSHTHSDEERTEPFAPHRVRMRRFSPIDSRHDAPGQRGVLASLLHN